MNDQVPQLDLDQAMGWIHEEHDRTGGWVSVCAINTQKWANPPSLAVELAAGGADEIAAFLTDFDRQGAHGLYVRQTSLIGKPEKRGAAEDSLHLPGLWMDGDIAGPGHKHVACLGGAACYHPQKDSPPFGVEGFKAQHRRVRYPLPADRDAMWAVAVEAGYELPTVFHHSGGGLNGYWLLDEPRRVTDGDRGAEAQLSARLHDELKHAAARLGLHYGPLGDMARVMRLPGTPNRKPGMPPGATCRTVEGGTGRRFTWGELVAMVEQAEARTLAALAKVEAAPQPISRGPGAPTVLDPSRPKLTQANSPIDDFNARADWMTLILSPAGWTVHSAPGDQLWVTRPGKDPADGHSAVINGTGSGHLKMFSSDDPVFEQGEWYTKAMAWRELRHGGDSGDPTWSATNRDLRAMGYGDPLPPRDRPEPSAPSGAPDDDMWATLGDAPGGSPDPVDGGGRPVLPTLPVEFWEQRPYLAQIRDAAHARGAAADLVFHATLARLSGMIPHWAKADTGLGGLAPLNYFAAIVSDSGVGKSSDFSVAETLLQLPHGADFIDGAPLGSGEGIAELFMGEIEVTEESDGSIVPRESGAVELSDGKGKRGRPKKAETVRAQVRHNAFVTADEGTAMTELMHGRKGSTLGSTLRTAWSGGTLGNANASKDRYRVIPSGSYSIGMCVGFQRITVGPLLDDYVAGTPQRFAWVSAGDDTIPTVRPRGVRRGAHTLVWDPTIFGRSEAHGVGVTVAESIKDRLWDQHIAKKAGRLVVDAYDSHKPLFLVKVAGLLAVLDKRTDITEDDWDLAEQVWAGSVAVRTALLAHLNAANRDKARAGDEAFARQQVRAAEALEQAQDQAVFRVAKRVAMAVIADPGCTRGAINKKVTNRDRPKVDAAIEMAILMAWVVEADGVYQPGPSRPGDGS